MEEQWHFKFTVIFTFLIFSDFEQLKKEDFDVWRDRRLMLDSSIVLVPAGNNRWVATVLLLL